MIPKKAKDFRKQTAEDTGYSKELVNSFLDFYWERVRKDLSDFCNACCDPDNKDKDSTLTHTKAIFKTPQTVRNSLAKLSNHNIISKNGLGHNKTIELNKDLKIQTEGNVLLDYKFFHIGTQES